MTTTISVIYSQIAPVTDLLTRLPVDPAPVQVCHYCRNEFEPTRDPGDGSPWDLDDTNHHCCDDCYCATCTTGHLPDQSCPATLFADGPDTVDRDEHAVYDDPDARYDAYVENRWLRDE